ncbi:MAG: topoisomerase C-terminal repeat-containing protein [Candidatus Marinimicrobia bacterium]|nr:topoisomerase C-terminal repeat-containing protein [Candidatus Neomarinimicrobiota bacterium]
MLHGRYGPYIAHGGRNYKIPKDEDPETLTPADCKAIIAEVRKKKKSEKK